MNSSPPSRPNRIAVCDFGAPIADPAAVWRVTLDFLEGAGLASDMYSWKAVGSRRHSNRNLPEDLPGPEILRAMDTDEIAGFHIHAFRGASSLHVHLTGPFPKIPWQHFSASSQAPGMPVEDPSPLVERLASLGKLALGVVLESSYASWQRCNSPAYYAEHFGSIEGFRLISKPADPPFPADISLDMSSNPGRADTVNGGPACVASDMWLGPAFWSYAPCRRDEVASQSWLKVRNTEHFLFIKSYPEPFTRPDGEQGETQRRLWRLLFHSDSHWPPGADQMKLAQPAA